MSGETAVQIAEFVKGRMPPGGLFAGMDWRVATAPFEVDARVASELERLGRVVLQFYRAANLLYRKSLDQKAPGWVAQYLDQGKPVELLELQRSKVFKNDLPRVIRPDVILAEDGLKISELDSIPGGIGLTAWLNKTYAEASAQFGTDWDLIGTARSMQEGFSSIFGQAAKARILISKESDSYAPEMEWITREITDRDLSVSSTDSREFQEGEAIYRFFELFDIPNVKAWPSLNEHALAGKITLTPPPKPIFEEKMLLALLWNRNLRDLWRQELGDAFLSTLQKLVPYSWIIDPAPLPPHGAIPELNITRWEQLKSLSQRERQLILKISGFAESAWGARGVFLGSDLPSTEWAAAIDQALAEYSQHPYILQRYHKPGLHPIEYFDADKGAVVRMEGRVRLCPYYFVSGTGDQMRAELSGVLATVCPADKKIIHGMRDAVMAPVRVKRHGTA